MTVTTFTTTGANDQWVQEFGTVYPPTGNFSRDTTATEKNVIRAFFTPNYFVGCVLLAFDTSSLTSSAILSQVRLLIQITGGVANTDTLSFVGEYYAWDGTSNSDFTNSTGSNAISTPLAGLTNGSQNIVTLSNLANINTIGTTKLRLGISQRFGDTAPTGDNEFFIAMDEHATLAAPILEVTYTLPSWTNVITPDSILTQRLLAGSVTDIDEDAASPDTNWLTYSP